MLKYMIAGALALAATAAQAAVVTPDDLQGWAPANVRVNGTVAITDTYKPAGETGSLQFGTTSGADKADYRHALSGTLGDLVSQGDLSFDFYVDSSSTTDSHLHAALRLEFVDDATGKGGYLIWEDTYNDNGFAEDTWVSRNIIGGNFWMRNFAPGETIERYDVSLAEWASGATYGNSYQLSAATRIVAVEVGAGSGWAGVFNGAVDHVNVDFGTGSGGVSANFEAGAVPEPATWALMIIGFGGAGAVLRRRREAVAA